MKQSSCWHGDAKYGGGEGGKRNPHHPLVRDASTPLAFGKNRRGSSLPIRRCPTDIGRAAFSHTSAYKSIAAPPFRMLPSIVLQKEAALTCSPSVWPLCLSKERKTATLCTQVWMGDCKGLKVNAFWIANMPQAPFSQLIREHGIWQV